MVYGENVRLPPICGPGSILARRAFLKRPENFSGPRTFRGCFRARFSGFGKRFSKRPSFSRNFRGCFREILTQGIARASISQPVIGSKIAIDIAALSWVRHVRIKFKTFFVESPAVESPAKFYL